MSGRRVTLLLTHTSRAWDWEKCRREHLRERYAQAGRFENLPKFESLAPHSNHAMYSGGLTILTLSLNAHRTELSARRCIDSRYKIQHACLAGERLVLCFEDFLFVAPNESSPVEGVKLHRGAPGRIDDPWFGGLHTVFPVDAQTVVVSAASSDAVLWVDIASGRVTRRWRLPSEIYGENYTLTHEMSVQEHYVPNDIQLGHLNCAYPDSRGGCLISTLGQGDIGHVGADGAYDLLARGFVGCHGVRYGRDGQQFYFTDSCDGRLMAGNARGEIKELFRLDSRWLHDVQQVDEDIYVCALGDRNEVSVIDAKRGIEVARYSFESRGVNVQFLYAPSP